MRTCVQNLVLCCKNYNPPGFLKLHFFFPHCLFEDAWTIISIYAYIAPTFGSLAAKNYDLLPSDLSLDTSSESVYKRTYMLIILRTALKKKSVKYFYANRTSENCVFLAKTLFGYIVSIFADLNMTPGVFLWVSFFPPSRCVSSSALIMSLWLERLGNHF